MADLAIRIEAHALQNAVRYGKALTGKVIPKILGEFPDQKARMGELKPEIDTVVERVNAMQQEALLPRLQEIAPDLLEKKERKRELPDLKNAVRGSVVTRLPPEPSKYNHLGHALSFIINTLYAQKYDGKLILKFEDTNPEKVSQEFVDSMLEDIQDYLGIAPDETVYVSDRMDTLLRYAADLIAKDAAYMCFCTREEMSGKRRTGEECACRVAGKEQHTAEWEKFADGQYMDGECVLRFKGAMDSKNTVLRDPVLFRAVKTPHFRKGSAYRVWPMYDFYSPITDALLGVTHVLRSNEFDLRVPLHERIKELLGLPQQEIVHYGRFNLTGATTKGREIREAIEQGDLIGWDDPRLVTLKALKRRGIRKEAYWELANELGLSPYQVNLDFSKIAAINRRLLDPVADRYSFVEDPVEISVEDVEPHDVKLHLHPEKKDGGRTLRSAGSYAVARADETRFRGKRVRLMGDLTFEEKNGTCRFVSADVKEGRHDLIVNWLPSDAAVPVEVMMPDATVKKGLAERAVSNLKPDTVVQFERFGFCRLDAVEDCVCRFWYAHD